MQVLNRSGMTAARKLKIALSGQICQYNRTMAGRPWPGVHAWGVKFEGFGLTASFAPDFYSATQDEGICNAPKWHIYDRNHSAASPLLVIQGFTAELEIAVAPDDCRELVDISFSQDPNTGEYIWRGLPESGLPQTVYTPSYTGGVTWTGTVNGVAFAADGTASVRLVAGTETVNKVYDASQRNYPGGDAISGTVQFAKGLAFVKTSRTYSAAITQQIFDDTVDSSVLITSTGTELTMELTHPHSTPVTPEATASISAWPFVYNYEMADRHGMSVSGRQFQDVNGKRWTGSNSPDYEYEGVQTVTAKGGWAGDTKTISPAFDVTDGWQINDPAPARVGGVFVRNITGANDYSVTITDPETETETTYRPDKALLYAPLGPNGDLEGSLALSEDGNPRIDDFSSGWTATGGTLTGKSFTVTEDGAALEKTGFIRALYDAESDPDGELTAAELVPHLPHHNRIRVIAGYGDTETDLELEISAKGRSDKFRAVQKTTGTQIFDLTRPELSWWHQDRNNTLYDAWKWERYTRKGEEAEYINEDAQDSRLHGPILYSTIRITGWVKGKTYSLNRIDTSLSGNTIYMHAGFEFRQPTECGSRGDEGSPDVTIYRNRYLTAMRAGRFLETFSNQKSVTDMGYASWAFPTIHELTDRTGGNKLIWPRDDLDVVHFTATAPQGGTPAPAEDMVSSAAYIGWIDATDTALAIKPTCDYIEVDTRLYDGKLELRGITEMGSRWQGFVNATGDTLRINTGNLTSAVQFRRATAIGKITGIVYTSGGSDIYTDGATESVPGFLYRYAVRFGTEPLHGYIWRNPAGHILRNAGAIILRGDYPQEGTNNGNN